MIISIMYFYIIITIIINIVWWWCSRSQVASVTTSHVDTFLLCSGQMEKYYHYVEMLGVLNLNLVISYGDFQKYGIPTWMVYKGTSY